MYDDSHVKPKIHNYVDMCLIKKKESLEVEDFKHPMGNSCAYLAILDWVLKDTRFLFIQIKSLRLQIVYL